MRFYTIAPGKMAAIQALMREIMVPLLAEYGITALGFWAVPDGSEIYWAVRHDSLEEIGPNWERFHADPRWKQAIAERTQGVPFVQQQRSVPLLGVAGLPPQDPAAS